MATHNTNRLRIVSNGPRDLHIYDQDGNEVLRGACRSVTWQIDHEGCRRVWIETVPLVGVDVEGDVAGLGDAEPPKIDAVPAGDAPWINAEVAEAVSARPSWPRGHR